MTRGWWAHRLFSTRKRVWLHVSYMFPERYEYIVADIHLCGPLNDFFVVRATINVHDHGYDRGDVYCHAHVTMTYTFEYYRYRRILEESRCIHKPFSIPID